MSWRGNIRATAERKSEKCSLSGNAGARQFRHSDRVSPRRPRRGWSRAASAVKVTPDIGAALGVTDGATPYSDLPARAFWRTGVAEPGLQGLSDLWAVRWPLPADARFATFGSCFAQHIGRALVARKMNWVDAEPAPGRTPEDIARAFNYGVFSARTGNVYTAAQLRLLVRLATGADDPRLPEVWQDGSRFFDSLRPAIEPGGFASHDEALFSRISMLRAFRRAVEKADVFVFTLGLTEGWEQAGNGQPYAMCPGTVAGRFDAEVHRFKRYRSDEIRAALDQAFALMRRLNPGLRCLLTVSPVPLTATASGQHVLVATTHSKAVLRAVAGEMAAEDDRVDYFPSYEIITGAPARAGLYEANLRSVTKAGVDLVMSHFFAGLNLAAPPVHAAEPAPAPEAEAEAQMAAEELACEEQLLEAYARG